MTCKGISVKSQLEVNFSCPHLTGLAKTGKTPNNK